ncbi:HobA family DNA replication regulator [Helicobacter sp. MIT 21-1697]|uniref:HobA family DNA replication regulator n=1 Tax=Helicobacter sp. MIT 21-1697 TaxID=2993733 RepID=UPI00224B527A|nr:HobA family DNA replication regulator [Helicobacter sp. MIT 21-1697]MCX2716245.1 HobA family DNA replication regulator [Helicobacter sp. MIT 21-1697]
MESISDWFLRIIREDEKKGIMSGWIEEKRFIFLPSMTYTIEHIIKGGSIIVLTDEKCEWFGEYIITHINQSHKGRPFFPIVQIKHLHNMIDSNKEGGIQGFKLIKDMLDMMYSNYRFWYIGKKNTRSDFAKNSGEGWFWIFDENDTFLSSTDEKLDYKLLSLFKLFDRAILGAMLNRISLDI